MNFSAVIRIWVSLMDTLRTVSTSTEIYWNLILAALLQLVKRFLGKLFLDVISARNSRHSSSIKARNSRSSQHSFSLLSFFGRKFPWRLRSQSSLSAKHFFHLIRVADEFSTDCKHPPGERERGGLRIFIKFITTDETGSPWSISIWIFTALFIPTFATALRAKEQHFKCKWIPTTYRALADGGRGKTR